MSPKTLLARVKSTTWEEIEGMTARLAALNARGEDLRALEDEAAAQERFLDAAALQNEWLVLRSHVKVCLSLLPVRCALVCPRLRVFVSMSSLREFS